MSTPKDASYKLRQQEFRKLNRRSQDARAEQGTAIRDDGKWLQFRVEKITHRDQYHGEKCLSKGK